MIFAYNEIKKMEPRPGAKYQTTYYQLSKEQRRHMLSELCDIAHSIIRASLLNTELNVAMNSSLGLQHKKQTGDYYTPWQVMYDAILQLHQGKDMPESMVNRWNKFAFGTGHEIAMMLADEYQNRRTHFQDLFESVH